MATTSDTKELGWNPSFDEGRRLVSSHANFSGFRARLRLPINFACPSDESYFNFYLGINFVNAAGTEIGAVEAGISYSNTTKYGKGWRFFVNPGNGVKAVVLPGSTFAMELDVRNGIATLGLGDASSFQHVASGTANGSQGRVKMVAAIEEFHQNSRQRIVWFDRITFTALQVRKPGRDDWLNIDKIEGLLWKHDPPPASIHQLIFCTSYTHTDFSPYMCDPAVRVPGV